MVFVAGFAGVRVLRSADCAVCADPDSTINDPDALVEVSLEGKGTHRLPQDCIRLLED